MAKFKVGDKVKILDGSKIPSYTGGWNNGYMGRHVGEVHEITDVHERWGSPHAAYELDIGGICNHCKWDERALELVTTKKIVITTDGKITTATLYDGKQKIKSAEAKCAPADTFDFNYGARLALSRLSDDKTSFGERADKIYFDEFTKKSQMDKFLAGKVGLEVPMNKTMDFLKECERHGLRWHSGDKPTEYAPNEKYFVCEDGHLFFSGRGRDNSDYVWEKWNGAKGSTKKEKIEKKLVDDVMSAIEIYIKLMKDDLDD